MAAPLPDIVQGENRTIRIEFASPAATVDELAGNYRLGLSINRAQSDLLSINFGPAQVVSGGWNVSLTAAQTLALPVGDLYLGVWNRDTLQPVSELITLKVGVQAGRPT